jgi:hypothetical protein
LLLPGSTQHIIAFPSTPVASSRQFDGCLRVAVLVHPRLNYRHEESYRSGLSCSYGGKSGSRDCPVAAQHISAQAVVKAWWHLLQVLTATSTAEAAV